jgi:hypothetical protein
LTIVNLVCRHEGRAVLIVVDRTAETDTAGHGFNLKVQADVNGHVVRV